MQLSEKNDLKEFNSACSIYRPVDSFDKGGLKEASFNQSTLFSISSFRSSQVKCGAKLKCQQVEPQSVTFVEESFLSAACPKRENKRKSGKKPKEKVKKAKDKRGKRSKYNFVKNLFNASKEKFTNAKKFIMKIGKTKKNEIKKQAKNLNKKENSVIKYLILYKKK